MKSTNNNMKRTSLDGKSWNQTAKKDTKPTTTIMATLGGVGSDLSNLREASPPKKNPWLRNKQHPSMTSVQESRDEDFPLPSTAVTATSSVDAPTPGTVAATPTTASIEGSHRSSSRASSFSTPDVGTITPPHSRSGRGRYKDKRLSPRTSPAVSQLSPIRRQVPQELLELPELAPAPDFTTQPPPTSPTAASKSDEPVTSSNNDSDRNLTSLDGLWKNPVGADVHVRTSLRSFFVHRDIVTSQSGWFHDNLPSPRTDGAMVTVNLDCAPETAAYGLRFMYTHRIEICDQRQPFNPAHLPRCALAYCAAVSLRIKGMVTHILRVVEATTDDLFRALTICFLHPDKERNWWVEFGEAHLGGALEIVYGQPAQELMKPMRMGLAAVLDATLFWLIAQPSFREVLETDGWKVWLPRILADVVEYRRMRDALGPDRMTIVPNDAYMESLLSHPALRGSPSAII